MWVQGARFDPKPSQVGEKDKQVAQRAMIAHLRANFTFSYCKFMGDDDPPGVANLDPRGMIGRIYVVYHLLLLHTKY